VPRARQAGPLLLAVSVWLLARVEAARGLVPALGLFTGPLGLALLGLGLAAGVARFRRGAAGWALKPSLAVLFVVAFLLAAGLGLHHVSRLAPTGDEIRYLIVAQSLWRDGDIDLRDNFDRGDYREYVPELRRPLGIRGRKGPLLPLHRPGLPALVAPAYALAGRIGCAVLLAALLSALGLVVRRLALRATRDEAAAFVAWASVVGSPALSFAAFLYPEVPAALCVALALSLIAPDATAGRAAAAALAVSFLPWLHPRLALGAVALGAVALVRLRGRSRIAFTVCAAAMAAGFVLFNKSVYGAWVPMRAYKGTLGRAPVEQALTGLLLDPSFGLLVYAPVFVLALAGLVSVVLGRKREGFVPALLLAALVAPVARFGHWYGGFSAPARLVTAAVPLLAVLAALRYAEHGPSRRGLARWAVPLLAAGLALTLFLFAAPERKLHVQGRDSEPRAWSALAGDVSLARYLPRMARPADPEAPTPDAPAAEKRVAIVWGVALLGLLALDRLAARSDRVDRAFRGVTLPAGLFLLLSLAVDGWARQGEMPTSAPPTVEDVEGGEDAE